MKNPIQSLEEKKKKLEQLDIDSDEWQEVQNYLQLELVFSLSKLEGSTLSKAETEFVAQRGKTIGGKGLKEQNNAYRYFQAISRLKSPEIVSSGQISEEFLIDLNTLHFLDDVTDQKLAKYSYKVPYVLTEYIEWLTQQNDTAVEIAVEAAIKLLQANVFGKDYPRTILLFINFLLLKRKYPLVFIQEEDVASYLAECIEVRNGGSGDSLTSTIVASVDSSLDFCLGRVIEKDPSNKADLLKIGELAKLTGESVPTIRHWTNQGLLQVADHTQGGYILYERSMAEVVLRIRYLQREERMSVREIRERNMSSTN